MRKILFVSLIVLAITGLAFTSILYAHGFDYWGDEEVKAEVKKIDKGIQITLTSDNPEIAKEIQDDARWYKRILKMGNWCPMWGRGTYSMRRGCM